MNDYKFEHYVKLMMDEVFGRKNFRNDIARIKCNPKNFHRKAYGNIKDLILFYSKSETPIWNDPQAPFSQEDEERLFKKLIRMDEDIQQFHFTRPERNMKKYTTVDVAEQQLEDLVRRHSDMIEEGLVINPTQQARLFLIAPSGRSTPRRVFQPGRVLASQLMESNNGPR